MKCQHCNEREATTYIKKNINGKKTEMHLCSECAAELGVMNEFSPESFLQIPSSEISSVRVFLQ